MYAAAGAVMVLYGILFVLSGRGRGREERRKIHSPFLRMAALLYEKKYVRRFLRFGALQVEADLRKSGICGDIRRTEKEYYIKKLSLSLLVIFCGTLLAFLVSLKAETDVLLKGDGSIEREAAGGEGSLVTLEASVRDGEQVEKSGPFQVLVEPVKMTEKETKAAYQAFAEALPCLILGGNRSVSEITEDLNLSEEYEGYPFLVEWSSDRPDVISSTGAFYGSKEEAKVCLTANISCGEWKRSLELTLLAVPERLDLAEQVHKELEALLDASQEAQREMPSWKLPAAFEGKPVEWKQRKEDYGPHLWITFLGAGIFVYFLSDKDLHEKVLKRKEQLVKEYPNLIHKLVLYLGAGLAVRGAFEKIAEEYRQGEAGQEGEPAYEELLYACRELQAGISESEVYERFGKRSGLQEYIRLGTLLAQNLKKGNAALLSRLKEESVRACLEQQQYGRRLVEEASTKLLIPMVMLLAVVMVMVMLPAFSSMGG